MRGKRRKWTVKLTLTMVILSLLAAFGGLGCGKPNRIRLYFDGGGGSGNYTTTRDYRTLQTLAEEWNANNDTYEIVINNASLNGNRSSITSMLSAGTAPDLLMQVGSVVNDDIGNGWYVPLNDYLERPNPYQAGNTAWKELYEAGQLSAAAASDGKNYYVCLDNIALGMIYNMDILNQAGISEPPVTYSGFLDCLETLRKAKEAGKISADIYLPSGLWQENYLGTSVYGEKIAQWDTDRSGTVSTYELISAYKAGKWTLGDPEFREFLGLCGAKSAYYPANYLGYDVAYKFAKGQLAVTDGVGNTMRTLAKNARFNLKITGYPVLDGEASPFGGYTVVRGSAGLSSAYWVTNSAVNKGQGAVDACVDFLMYLTATDNNARLVNELGYALPLDVSRSTVETFEGLVQQYKSDLGDENSLLWSACFLPSMLGSDFDGFYQLAMGDFYQDSEGKLTGDADAVIAALDEKLDGCMDAVISKYGWTFAL